MTFPYRYPPGKEPVLCGCGCGQMTKYPGATFVHGHHLRVLPPMRKKGAPLVLTCKGCSEKFTPKKPYNRNQLYCSRKCSADSHKSGCTKACVECAAEFYVPANRTKDGKGTFCSKACLLANWSRTSLVAERKGNYRANAWKVFSRVCADCGYDTHPEIILIHHIDGDRHNGRVSNLVPLCQNCHCLRHIAMRGDGRIPSSRHHGTKMQ